MMTLEGVDPQMIANNLKPFQPTHPGEVLKDELEYRGISQRGLAKEIGISYSAFNEMLNGKRSLSPELAMMMEAALGVDAAPLLAMQNEYDMQMQSATSHSWRNSKRFDALPPCSKKHSYIIKNKPP
jgi:addiction module HigA family antidote